MVRISFYLLLFLCVWNAGFAQTENTTFIPCEHTLDKPVLNHTGTVTICPGAVVTLQVESYYYEYCWSTGDCGRSITVQDEGNYWVAVRNENSPWMWSDTVTVKHHVVQGDIIGKFSLCDASPCVYKTSYALSKSYLWSVEGGVLLNGNGSDSVSVKWLTESGIIYLTIYDSNVGCTIKKSRSVQRVYAPSALTVTPDTLLCEDEIALIAVPEEYDEYTWNNGAKQQSIQVSEPGEYYCTVRTGTCVFETDTVRIIALTKDVVKIEGDTINCGNVVAYYWAPEIRDAQYLWTVSGGNIMTGKNTSTIEVLWTGNSAGQVRLAMANWRCVMKDTMNVHISLNEQPEILVDTDSVFCDGDEVVLSVQGDCSRYLWSTGDTTKTIIVRESGTYTVSGTNGYGCIATADSVKIVVYPVPATPQISRNGNLLTCTVSGNAYIWYRDTVEIPGETSQSIIVQKEGVYTVSVFAATGCSSTSQPYSIVSVADVIPSPVRSCMVTPNPSNGIVEVQLEFEQSTAFSIRIADVTGRTIYSNGVSERCTAYRKTISIRDAVPGVYFLSVEYAGGCECRKLLLRK